ncbi:hypothetical protein DFH27DRAFT_527941 [Peziza echinospora]|nr:hypothetical protein DFH27DRAFT_527941 [Peziza echinospora]
MDNAFKTPAAETMIDMYIELDAIEWYYKLAAAIANWAMLAGFIVFPNAFDDQKSKFRVDANSLRVIAICLLVFAYILTGILCWRFKNLLFQVESIFLPGFTNSTIGFVSSLFNVYGKVYDKDDEQWSHSAILAIVLSSVFMIFYGSTSLNANRKLDRIRKLDEYRRQLLTEDVSTLPEEERTRRNLLNLLLSPQPQQRPGNVGSFTSPPGPSSFESSYTPVPTSSSRFSRFYPSPSIPPTPHSATSASHLMTSYPAYSPPSMGLGIAGDRASALLSPKSERRTSRWGIGRARSASASTAYVSPSMHPPQTPSYAPLPSSEPQGSAHTYYKHESK